MIKKCFYSCSNHDGIIIATQCLKALIMSRRYLIILLLLPFLPHLSISQTIRDSNSKLIVKIENGEIRGHNSRKLGSIASDGSVRNSNGKKLGTMKKIECIMDFNQKWTYKIVTGSGRPRILSKFVFSTLRSHSKRSSYH